MTAPIIELRASRVRQGWRCPDCGLVVIADDDDAGVCIECGGRNRRFERIRTTESALRRAALFVALMFAGSYGIGWIIGWLAS